VSNLKLQLAASIFEEQSDGCVVGVDDEGGDGKNNEFLVC
jgi:hypothetical protein